ncbi:MAG: DNA polymerase [Candidatus Gribaldobacteria bacterium]|nr:DNA polymerase [Candidatus Gribaldobacteria bacterium]
MPQEKSKKLLVIDGNALIHRAYYALPPLKTKDGKLVNAVYGFLLLLLKAIKDLDPQYIVATFDLKGPTFRHEQFKAYKAQRVKAPDELYEQLDYIKEILRALSIPIYEQQGFEADDVIGTIAVQAKRKQVLPKIQVVILSGDLDNLQLVDAQVRVYTMRKGLKDTVLFGETAVKEKYDGLIPAQLLDYRGLKGDPSDNIPGVTGIGEKTAIGLLKEFGTLENIYQAIKDNSAQAAKIKPGVLAKLKQYQEQAFLSKQLSTIHCQVPIDFNLEDCLWGKYDPAEVKKVLSEYGFYSLIDKFLKTSTEDEVSQGKKSSQGQQIGFNFSIGAKKVKMKGDQSELLEEIKRLQQAEILSSQIVKLEKNLIPVVEKMQALGIKTSEESLKKLSDFLSNELNTLEKKIYQKAGLEFNINSPAQVSEVLFKKLEIPITSLKKTPKGVISTRESELMKLKGSHPIVALILDHRELAKLKTGFVDALPKMITESGRIHPHFHQLGTETGRMSCSNPNLQNIPTRGILGQAIRKCFVAQEGYQLLSADYSQVELRIAAWLSGDIKMQSFFKQGLDIHTLTASQIFNLKPQEITKEKRDFAKTLNFGILYGMGPNSLAQRTGVDQKTAKGFIQKYFENFSGIAEYVKKTKELSKEKGFSETFFGRRRYLPEINSSDQRLKSQAERMAVNMGPQGTSADAIKMAMVKLNQEGLLNDQCRLLLQIHDELLFEISNDALKKSAKAIKVIMENIIAQHIFLAVDLSAGNNWGELKSLTNENS